jgi:hypothetical protein
MRRLERITITLAWLLSITPVLACGDDGATVTESTTGPETESGSGDGDGDSGDGDGDSGDGDGDSGDGDGDSGDGDGDGDGDPGMCPPANDDTACEACVKANCCMQLDACLADVDCECLTTCLQGGNNQLQCNQMCGVMGVNQAALQLLACTNNSCAVDCA